MKRMTRRILFLLLFTGTTLVAQKTTTAPLHHANPSGTEKSSVSNGGNNEAPRFMEFSERTITYPDFLANINRHLSISGEFTFIEKESSVDQLAMRHHLLQQVYKGLQIEGMEYRVHERNGFLTSANGKAIRKIQLNARDELSEQLCFQNAIQLLQTKDTTTRKGKKLIVSRDFTFSPESFFVAYQFDIDVSLTERWRVSIDAATGQLINKVSLVNHCFHRDETRPTESFATATGLTNYYGKQTIQVKEGEFGLRWLNGRTANGGEIQTYSYNNGSIWSWFLGFPGWFYQIYTDTTFFSQPRQQTGVSVQWAAEKTYEYYFLRHGRNSFDNHGSTILSLVHVDEKMNNAFWSRNTLLFGDGSNNNPLVELDVVGHEFSHGVTQYEADLQYTNEPGALNESFSDIFGKAIEFETFKDTATWQLARHYMAGGLRDLSNPNRKNQPDTWMGDFWYTGYEDFGGVHYNSGVQNFWYYLLCVGGSGVNDHQEPYTVNAIGMEAATKIAYRNLNEYLGYFSDYQDSRIGSLLAAADLYGKNSVAYQQTVNAWEAVGVIERPVITGMEFFDITATTVKVRGDLIPRAKTASYYVEYGTTPMFGNKTATFEYKGGVTTSLTGLQSSTKYYVRLVASNESGSSFYSSEFTTISLAPLVSIKQTVDVTESTATLSAEVNPNSLVTTYYFQYGLTPSFGLVTPVYSLPDTTEFLPVSLPVDGLQPRKTYYFRLVATNGFASSASETLRFFTATAPRVFSFSPPAGIIGSEITIVGKNFHTIPENNRVRFGSTRATVRSATATQLVVTVPPGASLAPITVLDTESGLAGQSIESFVPTFSGEFEKKDIQPVVGIEANVYQTLVDDMDGDGKPDLAARHTGGFSVFQNVNQGGEISATSFVRNIFNTNTTFSEMYAVDFDGNGLRDLAFVVPNGIRIYPNYSVPGFIFFGQSVELPQIGLFSHIAFHDFDQDGHVDITTARILGDSSIIVIYRNQNPKGFIDSKNFNKSFSMKLAERTDEFAAGDLNRDGKPDLLASKFDQKYFTVFANESMPGIFAFRQNTIGDQLRDRNPNYIVQDFNQDGWQDILSYPTGGQTQNMTLLENDRTSPAISMKPPIVPRSGYSHTIVVPADFNGDGKVDFIAGSDSRSFTFIKNKTVATQPFSALSFERFEEYSMKTRRTSNVDTNLSVNDLNGDGRPEVINVNSFNYWPRDGYNMEIWQNAPPNCPDPSLVDIRVVNLTVTLKIPDNFKLEDLEMAYSSVGSTYWEQIATLQFNLFYRGAYRLRVRAKCYLGFTDYAYKDFATDCIDNSNFSIVNIQWNSATVQAINFSVMEVQFSPAKKNQWETMSAINPVIANLNAGTTYDVRYRGRCPQPISFNYIQFTTLCPKLTGMTITDLRFNSAKVNWTGIGSGVVILEYSPDNVTWIQVGPDRVISNLKPAQKYFVRGKMVCTDLTSDLMFTSFTTPCPQVTGLSANAATPFSARIRWSDESNTNNYVLAYEIPGRGSVLTTTRETSFQLNDLNPGTTCAVRVAPECSGSKEFVKIDFTTLCFVPVNLGISRLTHTSAEVVWDDPFGGVPYTVDYSISGSNRWTSLETTSKNVLLTKLRPATAYDVRVRITCTSVLAQFAANSFKTKAYSETIFAPNPTLSSITIYPSSDLIGRSFSIYDRTGRQMISGTLQDYSIDLSALQPGVYNLVISGEGTHKIVKL